MSNIQARLAAFESESGLVIPADLAEHFRFIVFAEVDGEDVFK